MLSFTCKSKKSKLTETEIRLVVARGRGEIGEGSQQVQILCYKTNKFQGCNVKHGDKS